MNKKLIILFTILVLIPAICGCHSEDSKNGLKTTVLQNDNTSNISVNTELPPDDNMDSENTLSSNSYMKGDIESVLFALLKSGRAYYTFTDTRVSHLLTLVNDSTDSIHITGMRVEVENYEPIPPEGYVLSGGGYSDSFDPIFAVYSEVGTTTKSYDAYCVDMDELGFMVDDSLDWNPIIDKDLAASDSINYRFFIDFLDTGIYKYNLIIDYDYNGKKNSVSSSFEILYDNDAQTINEAFNEFSDNNDKYFDMLKALIENP